MKQQLRTNVHEKTSDFTADIHENHINLHHNMDLLSILKDAVIITDKNFRINYWNPAAEEIYGWNSSVVTGKLADEVLRTKYIGTDRQENIEKLIEYGSYEDEVIQFTKKNFPLYISSKVVSIDDVNGNSTGYISINRDMTTHKNTEKKLERSYNILSSIIENTTDAIYLKNLSGNYIMANSSVSEIVGKPISKIIGRNDWELFPLGDADVITKEDKEIIENVKTVTYEGSLYSHREGEVRNYITTKGPYMGYDDTILGIFGIGRDITHLKQELIDDLLEYSNVNTKNTEFTDVDIGDVLEIVKVNLDILINENDAIITSDNLPVAKANKTQMIQLFQNLISNSIKYSGKERPVIHISAKKDGNNWLFGVEDNGIGIKPEYGQRIFKIFKKLPGSQKYGGTGMGLAISKRIIEKHGGTIWIDTNMDNGTKFNFSMRSG
jgi:PAS domain S-box-containing protein